MIAILSTEFSSEDLKKIEHIVRQRDSFVSLVNGDTFSILEHLNPLKKLKFRAMGDLNFISRIADLAKPIPQGKELKDYRWAAAVLAFCHLGDIEFEYDVALLEFAHSHGIAEAQEKFQAFNEINNIKTRFLVDFAVGRIDRIPPDAISEISIPAQTLPATLFRERTFSFQFSYILMLKIALLQRDSCSNSEKVLKLIDWMHHEFMLMGSGLIFANLYFSPSRRSNMIKGFSKAELKNAAWDVSVLTEWSRVAVQEAGTNRPLILITGDKAMKDAAMRLTAESYEEFRDNLAAPWGKKSSEGKRIFEHYQKTSKSIQGRAPRAIENIERVERALSDTLFGN